MTLSTGWELPRAPYRPCSASRVVWGRGLGRPEEGTPAQVSPSRRPCPEVLTGPFSKSETPPPPTWQNQALGSEWKRRQVKAVLGRTGCFSKERPHQREDAPSTVRDFGSVLPGISPEPPSLVRCPAGSGVGARGSPPRVLLSGNEEQWLSPRFPEPQKLNVENGCQTR